ncbi:MAG: (2E,6E)-farnesyl diphosphate synthase [Gammaproteobacteria bacterium]|nr:(2E,6E)-farnesyl diphosphate synthase [Gammaproteobacteria bacterium]
MRERLQPWQARIESCLARYLAELADGPERLRAAMAYSLLDGGKRVRPVLVYAAGEALGGGALPADLDACAAAIECIHVYSLIHDDLPAMDDDALRRGKPTNHIAFDEATAILAGDALQALAFEILASHRFAPGVPVAELLRSLARASGAAGMCGGQAIDLDATGRSLDLDALERMHRLKTGALIAAAVRLGALCVPGVSEETLTALDTYARAIGLAFQVQDDILDIESDTETLGKPQGSDQDQGKVTYPALLGLAGAKAKAEELVRAAELAVSALPGQAPFLKEFAHYIIRRRA